MNPTLENLAPGVYAWLHGTNSHSNTNSGLVIASDGLTVIDAGPTPAAAKDFAHEISLLTDIPVKRLVFTSSHIAAVGGGRAFPLAGIYGTGQTSEHLDQEPNPDTWARLHPQHDFTDVTTRPVSHTVAEAAHLCAASIAVPIGGPQFENLVVQVPSANVVFGGSALSFGTVPLGFEADVPTWIASLNQMREWGEVFVPGHGPVGGVEELQELTNYLEAITEAKGNPGAVATGPWDGWADSHFTPVNVERAWMLSQGDPSPPPSMLALLGLQ